MSCSHASHESLVTRARAVRARRAQPTTRVAAFLATAREWPGIAGLSIAECATCKSTLGIEAIPSIDDEALTDALARLDARMIERAA